MAIVRIIAFTLLSTFLSMALAEPWTVVRVENIEFLGTQQTPDVTKVSRDGGFSCLINGNKAVWTYADTECFSSNGHQLSFLSNTAATSEPNKNISLVHDYGIEIVERGNRAILAGDVVGMGGWINLTREEYEFNEYNANRRRIAVCK